MVAEYLKEGLLAREAGEMGSDQNDPTSAAWRRRWKFVVQDTSRLVEPSEDELHRFYDANLKQFSADVGGE